MMPRDISSVDGHHDHHMGRGEDHLKRGGDAKKTGVR